MGGDGEAEEEVPAGLLLAGGRWFLGFGFRGHGSRTVGYVLGWCGLRVRPLEVSMEPSTNTTELDRRC